MHPAYFETGFDVYGFDGDWPQEFVIITAYAPTGTSRAIEEDENANEHLRRELESLRVWHQPVTGYSASTGHAEPGWAVKLPFSEACALGLRFHQDAIYHVHGNHLFVSHCDDRRGDVFVGTFRDRVRKRHC